MKTTKDKVTVKVNVRPGSGIPVQKQAWKRFWQKIITEVKASER